MQGIVGPFEAHREARWLDDDESQVSTKLKIRSIPARWIRFLVIPSNFVTRSFSCELLKFSKDLFNVRPVNLRQIFFFHDGTGSTPNGATINYRKRISSFQARTSFSTSFNFFSPIFFLSFILILFHPITSLREFSQSLSVHLPLTLF